MSEILVLMRHGKAEKRGNDKPDFERVLTEAGKRSLAATLRHSLGLFPRGEVSVQVWSSPAARADQTARIMQRACKQHGANVSPELTLCDELWSQDADGFLDKVRECSADIVVAVGHNPFIEDLTAWLTGSSIDFATGGFAAIHLPKTQAVSGETSSGGSPSGGSTSGETTLGESPSGESSAHDDQNLAVTETPSQLGAEQAHIETDELDDVPQGRLLWFAQGPISQRWKTIVQMESALADSADAVKTRLEGFLENPDDVETMHKFRVSIRTLRSLLAFVSPWMNADQNKSCQTSLKSIVSTTSRLRELDVLAEQARALDGASPEFVEFCEAEASSERARVADIVSSKRTAKKLERVIAILHDVKWRKRVNEQGLGAHEIRSRFDGLVSSLQADLDALDISDVEKTHDVRKSAKRVRYDAEKFKSLIGDDAVSIAKSMTAHQDNLGAICDARVNIDIINGFPISALPEPIAWELALLRAQNETFLYTTLRQS